MACCSQDWGWDIHESPSVNILHTTKLLHLDPLSWDMDCLLALWPLLTPCSLGNSCCTFGFLIFIIVERNSLYNSLYMLIEKWLKHLYSIRAWVSVSFFLFLSPSGAWKPTELTLLPGLSRPPWESALCLHEWCKPCSRVLLVICINQGVSASFSLSLSYRWLWTTRFRSIKGPQQATTPDCKDGTLSLSVPINFGTIHSFKNIIQSSKYTSSSCSSVLGKQAAESKNGQKT